MQNAVNNVPLALRIASGVSDQKEVISFFCGNDKFVVSIAKSFIYRIIVVWTSGPVSRFSMAEIGGIHVELFYFLTLRSVVMIAKAKTRN